MMEMPPLYTTQHIVDRALQLAEGWLKAERERIEEGRIPSDYEPAAAELSSYLHTAVKDYARSYGESCARMAREEERARIEASEVVQFLYGAGELDGVGYSEVPIGRPRYWWRSILRATIKG